MLVTTRSKPKGFTWSYSRLKNYNTCPKRYYNIDVARLYKEPEGEALTWGNEVHKHLALRIGEGTPLPVSMKEYEEWVTRMGNLDGVQVEQKLAITDEFGPCKYFDSNVWFRGIVDVIKIRGSVALIVDWKTGKIVEDSVQLALFAQMIFAHYPQVQAVRTEFIWLKEGASTREDFLRSDMPSLWAGLLPQVNTLRKAHDEQNFPAKSSGLCKRFCVVTSCPHHGA